MTLEELLASREIEVANLINRCEDLVRQAHQLRLDDAQMAKLYRDNTVGPWSTAIQDTFAEMREYLLLHVGALRQIVELTDKGEAALALRGDGEVIIRHLRELSARITTLRRDRPEGLPQVSLEMTNPPHRSGWAQPSNIALALLETLLPSTSGAPIISCATCGAQTDPAPALKAFGEETIRDVLSRLTWENSKVPPEILSTESGGRGPIWTHPTIVRLLAEPVEAHT